MCFILQFLFAWLNICFSLSVPTARHIQTDWVQYFDRGTQLLQFWLTSHQDPNKMNCDHDKHIFNGPGSYVYGFDIEDSGTDNVQFRHEQRNGNGSVIGSYGLLEPDGNLRIVHYIADQLGYRVNIENSKRENERHPPALYNDIRNFNSVNEDGEWSPEFTTKSSFLQSAEKNLQFFGNNYVHEKHIPPSLYDIIRSGSTKNLLINK